MFRASMNELARQYKISLTPCVFVLAHSAAIIYCRLLFTNEYVKYYGAL